jgi:hypothetical protein
MIEFGDYWAHAHDTEQILLMSLAPIFIDSSPALRSVSWLQEWKTYWLDHRKTHTNGCSDIDLARFLDSDEKMRQFRDFLTQYKAWLQQYGEAIPANEIDAILDPGPWGARYLGSCPVKYLLDFATKIEDVIDGRLENGAVQRKPRNSA